MNRKVPPSPSHAFASLTPESVLLAVEKACGLRLTNLCRTLNSYINRVFELQAEDGSGLIAKFYRPNRWSHAALQDEHDFLCELAAQEIPVIRPVALVGGVTLGLHQGIPFAVFPKKGGRSFDEYTEDQWLELGRLLGRVHLVGAQRQPRDRIVMRPDLATRSQLGYILGGDFMDRDLKESFSAVAESMLRVIGPLFKEVPMSRIHGDCHFSNLISRPGESFSLIDFDDMAVGPVVQDFWMLLPGYLQDSLFEVDLFLEGYETFRPFDRRMLQLIEPLRAMRYIHYISWCAHQFAEDGLSRVATDFGTREYWQKEISDLAEQLERIQSAPVQCGNMI